MAAVIDTQTWQLANLQSERFLLALAASDFTCHYTPTSIDIYLYLVIKVYFSILFQLDILF